MRNERDGGARKRVALTVAAGALLVALIWFAREQGDSTTPPAQASASPTVTNAPQQPLNGVGTNAAPTVTQKTTQPSAMAAQAADQAREALAQYLKFSEFPPWSRPADDSQAHLWKWNVSTPIGQAFTRDKKNRKVSANLALDKMFAGAGESITATVSVWYGDYDSASPEPADAKVVGWIEAWRPVSGDAGPSAQEGYQPIQQVTFTSQSGGPGHRYVATFTPSAVAALKAQQMETRFVAKVDPGDHEFPFAQPFRYASTDALTVLDGHADALAGGSLQVTFAADVKKLGPVMVQATLFDATGTKAIAVYDDYYRPAQLGPQEIKITFFGKAIHDAGVDGPYSVRALHGYVRLDDAEPPEVFWQTDKVITTASYHAADFSSSEWDSPEKQNKINQYKKLISDFEKNGF